MPVIAHVVCGDCDANIMVLPAEFYGSIASLRGVEAELAVTQMTAQYQDPDGDRFAVADQQGHYVCPECGRTEMLPPGIEGIDVTYG